MGHDLRDLDTPIAGREAGVVDSGGLVSQHVLQGIERVCACAMAAGRERGDAAGGQARADSAGRAEVLGGQDAAVDGSDLGSEPPAALAVAPLIATAAKTIATAVVVARKLIPGTLYSRRAAPSQQRDTDRPTWPVGRLVTTVETAVSLPVR